MSGWETIAWKRPNGTASKLHYLDTDGHTYCGVPVPDLPALTASANPQLCSSCQKRRRRFEKTQQYKKSLTRN